MGIFSLFKDNTVELEKQIDELEKKLANKDQEIENLIAEVEKANKISPKQLQIFEKNINESRKEAAKYKEILLAYNINPEKKVSKYRVDISEFYSKREFPDILTKLEENDIKYLDELSDVKFYSLLKDVKKVDEAKKKFVDYKAGRIEWSIITILNKGEKITKIYPKSKFKKLNNIFSNLCLEYLDDIVDFDFNSLKIYDFSSDQIKKYRDIRDEYYKKNKVIVSEEGK